MQEKRGGREDNNLMNEIMMMYIPCILKTLSRLIDQCMRPLTVTPKRVLSSLPCIPLVYYARILWVVKPYIHSTRKRERGRSLEYILRETCRRKGWQIMNQKEEEARRLKSFFWRLEEQSYKLTVFVVQDYWFIKMDLNGELNERGRSCCCCSVSFVIIRLDFLVLKWWCRCNLKTRHFLQSDIYWNKQLEMETQDNSRKRTREEDDMEMACRVQKGNIIMKICCWQYCISWRREIEFWNRSGCAPFYDDRISKYLLWFFKACKLLTTFFLRPNNVVTLVPLYLSVP